MAKDEAFRRAEDEIEEARRTGASILQLTNMGLTELPRALGSLVKLRQLYLWDNLLTELPESLWRLNNLQSLYISKNRFTLLPELVGGLVNLLDLDASGNRLRHLFEWIGNLSRLESLQLSDNQLANLPESIGNLRNLKSLDVSDNQLTVLPMSIGSLSRLIWLYLSRNRLIELPSSLGGMGSLSYLTVTANRLRNLPPSITNLPLKTLLLHGNPLLGLPAELLDSNPQKLLSGYFGSGGESVSRVKTTKNEASPSLSPPESGSLATVSPDGAGLEAPEPVSGEWWAPLYAFLIHILVGTGIFVGIAVPAVILNFAVLWLETVQVSLYIVLGLQIGEYALFTLDLMLFLVFLLRVARQFLWKIWSHEL